MKGQRWPENIPQPGLPWSGAGWYEETDCLAMSPLFIAISSASKQNVLVSPSCSKVKNEPFVPFLFQSKDLILGHSYGLAKQSQLPSRCAALLQINLDQFPWHQPVWDPMLLAEHNLQLPAAPPSQTPPLPILLASSLLSSASVCVSHS